MKNQSTKSRLLACLLAVAVIVIIILIISLLRSCGSTDDNKATPYTPDSTQANTLNFTPYDKPKGGVISIPATSGMCFSADQLQQTVDLSNPKQNNCYFVITLTLSDGTEIFKSDYLAPSKNITEITLNQPLQRGLYKNCKLLYSCYSLDDKTPLNNGEVVIEIQSI